MDFRILVLEPLTHLILLTFVFKSVITLALIELEKILFSIIVVTEGNPSDTELEDLAGMIGSKWKALGRRLGFDESKLTGFHKNNEEYEEKAYAMLLEWKQREGGEATYQILKEALCHYLVGRTDLGEKFCC